MTTIFLANGITVGFSIAALVLPIGVLCIRRTLTEGRPADSHPELARLGAFVSLVG